MKNLVISLCDITGHFVQPWVDAGYDAILVDPQHPTGVTHTHGGRITRIGHVIDHPETLRTLGSVLHRVAFVAGFPPCTDVAVSGSRWFEEKRKRDPFFQTKAALVAEQCRVIGGLAGCPWFFENPVSVFSSIFGKPNHSFNPWQYNGFCADDNYTKKTCLWAGGGFVMPEPFIDPALGEPDDRIHKCPPSPERSNFRSATPKGFALAVCKAHTEL